MLGSSSPFRKELLGKILDQFETHSPDIDESPLEVESPKDLVLRLALKKAEAVATVYPDALIITSDQVSVANGKINGKPGEFTKAFEQLKQSSGSMVTFLTSLCLYDSLTGKYQLEVEPFNVHFRNLSDTQIRRYLEKESPFNCAGGFKSESLGIALFNKMEGNDPNALIGLPLIKLVSMLNKQGIQIP